MHIVSTYTVTINMVRSQVTLLQIEPIVALKDRGVVHHMVLYICKNTFNDSHLNATGSCRGNHNMPPSIKECVGVSPMYAWAVGGMVSCYLNLHQNPDEPCFQSIQIFRLKSHKP